MMTTTPAVLQAIDALVARGGRFDPYWGWHDDHRHLDGTPGYRPALQQVRSEYAGLLDATQEVLGPPPWGLCLQLGLGETDASHEALRLSFCSVTTIDWGALAIDRYRFRPGLDVASAAAVSSAGKGAPYDLLIIDADHSAEGTARDHANYAPLVRSGGLIAFHDALRRPGFEDAVRVWRYLEELREPVRIVGSEVGFALIRKE